jgi:hypothetical protein
MTMKRLPVVAGVWMLVGLAAVLAQTTPTASLGPKVGSVAPAFSGVDQFGRQQTLQSLIGRNGLMLVFFRSADW